MPRFSSPRRFLPLLALLTTACPPATASAQPALEAISLKLPAPCRAGGPDSLPGQLNEQDARHRTLVFVAADDRLGCVLGQPGRRLELDLERVVLAPDPSAGRPEPVATPVWWLRATLDGRQLRGTAHGARWEDHTLVVRLRGVEGELRVVGAAAWIAPRPPRPKAIPYLPTEAGRRAEQEALEREEQWNVRGCIDELRTALGEAGLLESFDAATAPGGSATSCQIIAKRRLLLEFRRTAPECVILKLDDLWDMQRMESLGIY